LRNAGEGKVRKDRKGDFKKRFLMFLIPVVSVAGIAVYYVFFRLFEEAKTAKGRELAKEKWEQIRPELVKLMGLKPDQDPIMVLGVPTIFQ
jgi:hypothetical protein